jgi:hypothetical protein
MFKEEETLAVAPGFIRLHVYLGEDQALNSMPIFIQVHHILVFGVKIISNSDHEVRVDDPEVTAIDMIQGTVLEVTESARQIMALIAASKQ